MTHVHQRITILIGMLLVACFAAGQSATSQAAETPTPGDHDDSMRWSGRDRTYRIYLPRDYDGSHEMPLLIAMHGGLGTGSIFEDQTHFDRIADKYGFVVAYPDGWRRSWNAGSCCGSASTHDIDDVGFIKALKARLVEQLAIDPRRVYGTGFSNGAMLVQRIACEAPHTFAAVASVEGGLMIPFSSCTTNIPTATLLIGGLEDERVPWDGGTVRGTYRPSARQMITLVGKRNQCTVSTRTVHDADQVLCKTRNECATGYPVSWCRIANGGHQWAGGETYFEWLLGPNNEKFDASEYIWQFLSRFRLPADS